MNRSVVSAGHERPARFSPVLTTMNSLTETDIEQLIAACADERNSAGRDLLTYTGAQTFSGVMARLALSNPRDREELLAIIRRVLNGGLSSGD